jgi:hypothetical protein
VVQFILESYVGSGEGYTTYETLLPLPYPVFFAPSQISKNIPSSQALLEELI